MPHRELRKEIPEVEIESLSGRLRKDVSTLATEFGPRSIFAPDALERSAQLLDSRFKELGYDVTQEEVIVDPEYGYNGVWIEETTAVFNIVAEKKGTTNPDEIVILGAHYDTPGNKIPGANDNASGVATMLEIARVLKSVPIDKTLRFIGFVNEEPPFTWEECMGSIVSARRSKARGENIVAMVSLDEIGCYHEAGISPWLTEKQLKARAGNDSVICMTYGPGNQLLEKFAKVMERQIDVPVNAIFGHSRTDSKGHVWPTFKHHGFSDHMEYLGLGYPALCVTDTGPFRYGDHYHTASDTEDKLDYPVLAKVTIGLIEAVRSLVINPV